MIISKTYKTETSHIVREAYSKRCKHNLHGHSYKFIVHIKGNLAENGMVIDFGELKPVKEFIDLFDHASVFWSKEDKIITDFFIYNFDRVLIMRKNPTAENMARLIMNEVNIILKNCFSDYYLKCSLVEVWETETGRGIAEEGDFDDNDVFEYIHKNEY